MDQNTNNNCRHDQSSEYISICMNPKCQQHQLAMFCTFCSKSCHSSIAMLDFAKQFSQKVKDMLNKQNKHHSETFDEKYSAHFKEHLRLKSIKKQYYDKIEKIKELVAKSISQMKDELFKDLEEIQDRWIQRLTIYQQSQQGSIDTIEVFLQEHYKFNSVYQPYCFEQYFSSKLDRCNQWNLIEKVNRIVKEYNRQQVKLDQSNKEIKSKVQEIQKQLNEFEYYLPQFNATEFQKNLKNVKGQINKGWDEIIRMGYKSNWTYFDKNSMSMRLMKTRSLSKLSTI